MTLRDYWKSLNNIERHDFADRVGVSEGYMRVHLIPARKTPRDKILYGLSEHSHGNVTHNEVLQHFYPEAKNQHD